jgi:cell division septum initiation protein DivIVA
MDELSSDISTLSQDNEDLRNKITDLEDQLEEASNNTSTGSYTPTPSLKSVCGDVPLPITNATQAQRDCFNNWHKKYISN